MSVDLQVSVDDVADATDFSGVVRVSRGGTLLCESCRGLADRAHGVSNTSTTRFGIASGTKGFTALTIMSLVAEGSLALDTSVRSVLGNELGLINLAVTVGHLLAHTSGIGDYLDESTLGDVDDYIMPVPVHRLANTTDYLAVLRDHPAKFEAGQRFEYCNSGFVILALIAEVVSGLSFYDLVAERVLAPAGMTATGFPRSDEPSSTRWFVHTTTCPPSPSATASGSGSVQSESRSCWRATTRGSPFAPLTTRCPSCSIR